MKRISLRRLAKRRHLASGIVLALSICASFCPISKGSAQTIGSFYTSTAPKDCRVKSAGNGVDDSTIRICPGKAGFVVVVSEDDLRETVSIGSSRAAADKEPAAAASFGPFNSTTPTVEWRAQDGEPFAIIQRWHIADTADENQNGRPTAKPTLVVTRLPPGAVCHVAYVDVKANPTANELARKAADELARGFRCGKDEVQVIGDSGRAVELAVRR
ncbi:hypothetical protein [Bradyrhizobium sp.]|uniref:hypothetical protein n=1 Tax=Bradyrhizobium sp. TaxID=376 RepID=UPI0025C7196F|nr:hypothetical protein [Bradyrhizobium sp.]